MTRAQAAEAMAEALRKVLDTFVDRASIVPGSNGDDAVRVADVAIAAYEASAEQGTAPIAAAPAEMTLTEAATASMRAACKILNSKGCAEFAMAKAEADAAMVRLEEVARCPAPVANPATVAAAYRMAAHHDTGCDCEVCEAIRQSHPAAPVASGGVEVRPPRPVEPQNRQVREGDQPKASKPAVEVRGVVTDTHRNKLTITVDGNMPDEYQQAAMRGGVRVSVRLADPTEGG